MNGAGRSAPLRAESRREIGVKVAILEDEPEQAQYAATVLEGGGHIPLICATGDALIAHLRRDTVDLLLLDWNVPNVSGLEVIAWAREHLNPTPPILMLTGRMDSQDVVTALEAGADDYVTKPLDAAVLLARIGALIRRAYPTASGPAVLDIAGRRFNPLDLTVDGPGGEVALTEREFALALIMFKNINRQLSRAYLLETVWGWSPDVQTRTLDAHISRLRGKLDLRPENGFRLAPVYSYGYRLEHLDGEGHVSP